MNIYRHETSQTTASGCISSTTLNIRGGLLRQVLVRALTSNTAQFRMNITETGGIKVVDYGYHEGELNDLGSKGALPIPLLGNYTINITNASPDDTFSVRLLVEE